jgi:hypothetical protein
MSSDSSFLVYFRGACTIDAAERALREHQLDVVRTGDALAVSWHGGPTLHVGLSSEPHVVIEAAEIAEWKKQPALAACDRRFEVGLDDLEAVLDETNTLFEVQATLQDLVSGWAFLSWNGNLIAPE